MLEFKPVTKQEAPRLRRYYQTCEFGLCEYSVGTKLMWKAALHPAWAEIAGCLVVRNEIDGQVVFDYPVPGPEGDEDAALEAIENDCLERGIPPVISVVPECRAAKLLGRYPYVRVSDVRTWRDYVYYREDLQFFAGRRYSGQRNHINKFRSKWPDAQFRPLTAADAPVTEQFWQDYEAEFPKDSNAKAKNELELAKKMLKMTGKPYFFTGGMFDGEKLIALSLAEKCGDTLIIHIEKALYSYTGVYPALVQAFADAFGDGCQWINREDDAADKGLRTSKLQYGPARLAPKYRFDPQNELLNHVQAIPELKTERLTLSALTEADIPAYNALVLDADRNRWWGYDDVGGLGGRQRVSEMETGFMRKVMALNFDSLFFNTRAALPLLKKGTNPSIINFSTIAVTNGGGIGASIYAASKGAVQSYSRALAKDLAEFGIRVNMVSPGTIDTPFHAATDRKLVESWKDSILMKRLGEPREVADVIEFLASDKASFLTGEVIQINGGQAFI